MSKYTNIEEFEPVELIIVYDIHNVPDQYLALLKQWLTKSYGTEGEAEDL